MTSYIKIQYYTQLDKIRLGSTFFKRLMAHSTSFYIIIRP